MDLEQVRAVLAETPTLQPQGKVVAVVGLQVRLRLPGARVGDPLIIRRRGTPVAAEVVGFDGSDVVAIPFGDLTGVGPQDLVESAGEPRRVGVGAGLLGRMVDGLGHALDGGPPLRLPLEVPIDREPPPPLQRQPIRTPLVTGVKAVDGFLTLGVGQRIGIFSGSGVGKSALLASIARGASADVVIAALVGERGREVLDFIEYGLGQEVLARSVLVLASSGSPALERIRAAQTATTYAEYFRDQGHRVLLVVDSLTRVARAQREVGLAAGEPPTRRGYPASVFSFLPRLVERAGTAATGAITAIYTVLVEGGDLDEPVADELRGLLDGHIVLDRRLATECHYPAIHLGQSISRVMDRVVDGTHRDAAAKLRRLWCLYQEKRDLLAIGGHSPGADPDLDQAIAVHKKLDAWLRQSGAHSYDFAESVSALVALAERSRPEPR